MIGNSPNLIRANRLAGLFDKATVVIFAGIGGVCIGVERAYVRGGFRDRYIDLAINHWDTAVGVHELNHPMTQHLHADVWEVDPNNVLQGRQIGYLHLSPASAGNQSARIHQTRRSLKPFRTAAECIDCSLPMLSIFATRPQARAWAADINRHRAKWDRVGVPQRPLKPKTQQRMAGGLLKWVLDAEKPFIIQFENSNWNPNQHRPVDQPLSTVTATPKGGKHAMVDVETVGFTGTFNHEGGDRTRDVREPMDTVTGARDARGVVGAQVAPITLGTGGAAYAGKPRRVDQPLNTVMVNYLAPYYGNEKEGRPVIDPMPTVVSKDRMAFLSVDATPHWIFTPKALSRAREVARWARKWLGSKVKKHLLWVTDAAGRKFALLMLALKGVIHIVTDIAMRMLRPRELARAQGFDDSYVIDRTRDGTRISKSDQVKLIGNSVCPNVAEAIAFENVVKLGVMRQPQRRRQRNIRPRLCDLVV